MAQQPLSVVLLSCRIASAQELLPPFPLGSKDVGRSFWLVRLANGQTCGPASSISPAQSRPRALRRSTASDSTDTPVSQSRALARCRPVIKLPRGRGDVALWSGDARSSIPGARSRSTLYYWTTGLLYAVAPPRREESLSLIPLCRMPSAVCRSPISQTPAWGSATAATAAALALQKRVCLAERDLHHGGPACTLSSSLGGRLKCCCYCDCCRSLQVPSSMSDPGSSFPVCCKYFPTSDVT